MSTGYGGTMFTQHDYRGDVVHMALSHDAQSLGLYDYHFTWNSVTSAAQGSGCIIL